MASFVSDGSILITLVTDLLYIRFKLEITYLNTNNMFSAGSTFSVILNQKRAQDPLLVNNSIQNWKYTHLRNGDTSDDGSKNLSLKTSFSSHNLTKGLYEGLSLHSSDSSSPKMNFSLSIKIKKEVFFVRNYAVLQNIVIFVGVVFELAIVAQISFRDLKLKANFGYASARFLTFFHLLFCMYFLHYISFGILFLLTLQCLEVCILALFWLYYINLLTFMSDLKEIAKKKAPLMLLTETLLVLLTPDAAYYPMVMLVPFLMAFVDRLQSYSCQDIIILIPFEYFRYIIVIARCYLPWYVFPVQYNLLMEFNYPNIALYLFIGFILIPALFLLHVLLSKKSVKEAKLVLIRREIHGKTRNCPMMIQEGQGDIIPTCYTEVSYEHPHEYSNKKWVYEYPNSTRGVIEVEIKVIAVIRGITHLFSTGFINFYNYKSTRGRSFPSLPQHCQNIRGLKPSIRFRVLNKGNGVLHLSIIPVETPEATNEQRFFAISLKSCGKLLSQLQFDLRPCSMLTLNLTL